MTRGITAAAVAVAFALMGCSGGEADAGATLACRSFRETAADYPTLTSSELRDRLADIDDDAKLSDEPGIAPAARAMIVAATSGTEDELVDAVNQMGEACEQADA